MRNIVIIFTFIFLLFSCSDTIEIERVVERCANPRIWAGYIIAPVENDRFIIIDNSIMRARVYYDNYKDDFSDYTAFLESVFSHPESIDYCQSVGICNSYEQKGINRLRFRYSFPLFANRYLDEKSSGVYTIKQSYVDIWPYILAYCFGRDYYIYFSDHAAEWIISKFPEDNLDYLSDF